MNKMEHIYGDRNGMLSKMEAVGTVTRSRSIFDINIL